MSRLMRMPRIRLATLPTPLQHAPRLSELLGIGVWFKRDDLTGFGLGGNKVRGLEFLIGDALSQGCDCLVTGAGPQSNWAMLAALAARCNGLDPHLVFYDKPLPPTGNLLLDQHIDAEIHYTGNPERSSVDEAMSTLTRELQAAGHKPYVLPRGGATALGTIGYVQASLELHQQLLATGVVPSGLWLPTGSCGTQAGLVAGAAWLRAPYEVIGVSVSRPAEECVQRVGAQARGAQELLGLPAVDLNVAVLDGHLGPGYGRPSEEGVAAAHLLARTEGLFLDPVFGAKALGALIRRAREDPPQGPVVFLVSGGAPTLFSHGAL